MDTSVRESLAGVFFVWAVCGILVKAGRLIVNVRGILVKIRHLIAKVHVIIANRGF